MQTNKQTNKNYVQCSSWVCSKWPVVVGVVNDTPYNIVTQSARILLLSERVTYASLTSIPNNIPYRILFVFSSPLFPLGGRGFLQRWLRQVHFAHARAGPPPPSGGRLHLFG